MLRKCKDTGGRVIVILKSFAPAEFLFHISAIFVRI